MKPDTNEESNDVSPAQAKPATEVISIKITDPQLIRVAELYAESGAATKTEVITKLALEGLRMRAKGAIAAPGFREVEHFCALHGFKPKNRAYALVGKLRDGCEKWQDQVRAIYQPKEAPSSVVLR